MLAAVEGWERFAIQGAKSLLTLYLLTDLLTHRGGAVPGLETLRGVIEGVTGARGDIAFASQLYGLYGALTYLVLPLGGWLADRGGRRRTAMFLGAILMALGLLALATRSQALIGMAAMIAGIGLLKGNLAAEVGALRGNGGSERLFAGYLACLNGGAMLGPLAGGWLALRMGFGAAFGAMAASMVVVMLLLRATPRVSVAAARDRASGRVDWPRVVPAILGVTLCFCAYEQLTNMVLVWARARVDLTIVAFVVPPSWLAAVDGMFTIALALAAYRFWPRLARHGLTPSPAAKLAAGGVAMALAYALFAWVSVGDGRVGMGGPLFGILLLDIGVVLAWPAALAIVTAGAPAARRGTMTGLFYLHGFVAHLVVGQLGAFYPVWRQPDFWLVHAALALAGAGVALTIRRGQATTTSTPASALA